MARNKYPEITVEKILDVSQRLFLEKGLLLKNILSPSASMISSLDLK